MAAMSTPEGADPSTPPGNSPQPPPGYQVPPPPGYAPGYSTPGYAAPGYAAPGYAAPGYYPPGYAPPQPGAPFGVDPYGRPYSDKNKIVAGVLQLAFGTVGAGRWYTGHYGIAIAQLLTCGGLGVWAIVDGILMLVDKVTDPYGRPLRG
jgi:TM2 domain-containing membrane protein YozV